jgi:hypothetical protein
MNIQTPRPVAPICTANPSRRLLALLARLLAALTLAAAVPLAMHLLQK